MNTISRIAGFLAPIVAFVAIAIAIAAHPWFSFTENAISDLGAMSVEDNYILNNGLIIAGILAVIFSYGLYKDQKSALGKLGAIIFIIASISLILIGLFPEDFKIPIHYPASVSFFVLGSFGILIVGLADERWWFGAFSIALFSIGWILALVCLAIFNGVAIPELIGAGAISLWVYAYLLSR